ncbi:MAG: cell division protein FtsL [Gammaproteobacteria bacterium]|nr:cell division protein FtsL [Gammaproteobacteria bacterium]
MNGKIVSILVLLIITFVSAISVVYVKHYNRKLFVELQKQESLRDEMGVEWGQLQLEQATWSTHFRMEPIAREKLFMIIPKNSDVIYVKQ